MRAADASAGDALRGEQDRLEKIAAAVPGVIYTFRLRPDGTMCFPYASAAAIELFGLRPEALTNDGTAAFARVHPDDLGPLNAAIAESARTLRPFRLDWRMHIPEKGEIWTEGHAVPQLDPDGSVLWHGILIDVTERQRAKEALQRAQKLEALGTLAGGIAHDFNNVLLAITGNTNLAMADLPPGHPAREALEEVAKAGARATELVRRILAFSRPEDQKREVLDLRLVTADALELVRAALPATIEIRREFADDVPPLAGDAAQIQQVIVNLATNASQAIGARSGRITFRIAAVDLDASAGGASTDLGGGRYVRLSVIDDGRGMDRATLARIFDPFYTTRPPGQGIGLGLSVAHGIVSGHRGAIRVESEPGSGAAFHVFLPATPAEPARPPAADAEPPRGGRVLYVDDEGALVLMARRSLVRFGWDVAGFTDPAKALEEFRARPGDFDVVVTDSAMPGMSGLELAAKLRATRPDVPIVLASGNLRPEDQEACERLGVRDLMQKPFSAEALSRVLERLHAR